MTQFFVCDLDDCLIKTDVLLEQWILLFKARPLLFFQSFFWLLKGLPYFKSRLSEQTHFIAKLLPYRQDVLDLLKNAKSEGTAKLVLASASPDAWIQEIAGHLGFFDHAFGTTSERNLKGARKLQAIKELVGSQSFTYFGDHPVDLAIWKESDRIIAVNPTPRLRQQIEELNKPAEFIYDKKRSALALALKQMRPHQWIKNALVFLPALAGHKLWHFDTIIQCLYAFAGFSFSASFVYVLNDILDLRSDRNHHTKKNRPFASGDLSIRWGILLLPTLLLGAGLCALALPPMYSLWIIAYLVLNIAYSLYFKQSAVIDIIILSMMYTLRIFAGSAATTVPVSEWLLSFSTLFFFSLACVKRYTEIIRSKNKITLDGRGYRQVDHPMIQSLGVSSGMISMLIILLYIQSKDVRALYTKPEHLWLLAPILLFWVSRIWILANRDEMHDDPVLFAAKDKVSWVCLVLMAAVLGLAI